MIRLRSILLSSSAVAGGAVLAASAAGAVPAALQTLEGRILVASMGAVLVAAAASMLVSLGAGDAMRLNFFLPVLRRSAGGGSQQPSVVRRVLYAVLPSALFSDRRTKRRGLVRRGLRWLGISWLAAPGRRISQSLFFLAFLYLFFVVCWPYDARPRPPAQAAGGWQLSDIDQQAGLFRFSGAPAPDWLDSGAAVFVTDRPAAGDASPSLVPLRVTDAGAEGVAAEAAKPLTDGQIDRLLISPGPWTMYDRDLDAWPSHYADRLAAKERIAAELFLVIDPLVSLSTAIASRSWVWSLLCAGTILVVCLLIPRGFCGYVCPLGTLIDVFDGTIGRRVTRFRIAGDGWWVHIKYYLLTGVLIAAACGVLVSGYVAAIPVVTRGMLLIGEPLQSGSMRGWHLVPPMGAGHVVSLLLFFAVLGLGLLRPRFWCKYVCPSGATFSLGNLLRLSERKVESSCIHCNKCVQVCPFDAIKADFTTRGTDCTLCQTCAGVCPTQAIKFVERGNLVQLKLAEEPATGEGVLGRRGFLSLAAGSTAAVVGGAAAALATKSWGASRHDPHTPVPVRPPGSVPEKQFLEMCIRCGECFKVCPNNVLQLQGFDQGLQGLWTPAVNADWAGCDSSCNACGQVCPTGAIRPLPLEEKRVARMGLAVVNEQTCLPFAGREACDLCVQECNAAGYRAIEYRQVGTKTDVSGQPIVGSGYLAPVVLEDACVGCGLCQTRCHAINVKDRAVLAASAIVVQAGPGKEDRLMHGSYRQLRAQEARAVQRQRSAEPAAVDDYFVPAAAEPAAGRGSLTQPASSIDEPSAPGSDPGLDPFGVDPFGVDPFGVDPFGVDPFGVDLARP